MSLIKLITYLQTVHFHCTKCYTIQRGWYCFPTNWTYRRKLDEHHCYRRSVLVLSILSLTAFAAAINFSVVWFKQSLPTTSSLVTTSLSCSNRACSNSLRAFWRRTSDHISPLGLAQVNILVARRMSLYSLRLSLLIDIVLDTWVVDEGMDL